MDSCKAIELKWVEYGPGSDIQEPTQSGKGDGFHINLTPAGALKAVEAKITGKYLKLDVLLSPDAFRIHFPELFKEMGWMTSSGPMIVIDDLADRL